QGVGREAVLDEAVRRALPTWYEQALGEAHLNTVGDPRVNLGDLPEQGSPLSFSIEVGIRPPAKLGDYKGLEVGRREPEVSQDDVNQEIERMRESLASLETVERAAEAGGFDSLDELRSDVETKLRQAEERVIEQEFRQAAVDAAVAGAQVDLPHDLVHSKAHEMWHETAHRLQHQGVDPARYLQLV